MQQNERMVIEIIAPRKAIVALAVAMLSMTGLAGCSSESSAPTPTTMVTTTIGEYTVPKGFPEAAEEVWESYSNNGNEGDSLELTVIEDSVNIDAVRCYLTIDEYSQSFLTCVRDVNNKVQDILQNGLAFGNFESFFGYVADTVATVYNTKNFPNVVIAYHDHGSHSVASCFSFGQSPSSIQDMCEYLDKQDRAKVAR